MLTLRDVEAGVEIHLNGCTQHIGPRGGVTTKVTRLRCVSRVKRWKRRPELFQVSYRWGLDKHTVVIDNDNAVRFHRADQCPLLEQDREVCSG